MENNEIEFLGVIVCPVCGKGCFPIARGTRSGGTITRCPRCKSFIALNFNTMKARRCAPLSQQFLSSLRKIG